MSLLELQGQKNTIVINGEVYKYETSFTVFSLLEYLGFQTDLIVVDYNGTILQKEFWGQTKIGINDTLEILTVAGGG
jgi:sulfur carrier protein